MLVLSTKCGESIEFDHAGETFTLKVLKVAKGRTKLGFDAPSTVGINRIQEVPGHGSGEDRRKSA